MKAIRAVVYFSVLCKQVVTSSESNVTSKTSHSEIIQLSSPEHVGAAHYQIIHNLQEAMRENAPQNHTEYLYAISIEMRKAACHENDIVCNSRIVQKTIELQPGIPNREAEQEIDMLSHLPENLDQEVANMIQDLMTSTELAKLDKPSEIVLYMNKNLDRLMHNEDVLNEEHRAIGLIAHSVGMESAKQWAEILNDPENPFNTITIGSKKDNHNRKLQQQQFAGMSDQDLQVNFVNILQADILGSVTGAVNSVFDSSKEKTILQFAMEEASIASMKSFGGNFVASNIPDIPGLSNLPGISNLGGLAGGNGSIQECQFPNAFWCDQQQPQLPPPPPMPIDEDCLFPNSPMFKDCDQETLNAMNEPANNPFGGFFGSGNQPVPNENMQGGNGPMSGFLGGGNPNENLEGMNGPIPGFLGGGNSPMQSGNLEGGNGPPPGEFFGGGNGPIPNGGGEGSNGATVTGMNGPAGLVLGTLLNPCSVPDSLACTQSTQGGNPFGNGNIGDLLPPLPNNANNVEPAGEPTVVIMNSATNNKGEEWTDDDEIWTEENIQEIEDNSVSKNAREPRDPDCPYPGEARCGKLVQVTAKDGTVVNCKSRSSPLCQMALGTFQETPSLPGPASGMQIQFPSQPRQKEP